MLISDAEVFDTSLGARDQQGEALRTLVHGGGGGRQVVVETQSPVVVLVRW